MKKISVLALSTILVLGLSGCASDGSMNRSAVTCAGSTVIGAGGGALIGNQFGRGGGKTALTAVGAVAGAAVGSGLGCQ